MSTEVIIYSIVIILMLGYGFREIYSKWWKIKQGMPNLFYEAKLEWEKSTKPQKATFIFFIASFFCGVYPSELISKIGYILQAIFVLLLIYILTSKETNTDNK